MNHELQDTQCYKTGALVTGRLAEKRQLNLDLEDLHPGFYAVQIPVTIDGKEILTDVLFRTVTPGATTPEVRASTIGEAVHAIAVMTEMTRIQSDEITRLTQQNNNLKIQVENLLKENKLANRKIITAQKSLKP